MLTTQALQILGLGGAHIAGQRAERATD